jgi:hypothetical protein
MVVERARGESQSMSGSLQSLCWGSSAFGGIVSSYFSGSLVDAYGVRYSKVVLDKCNNLALMTFKLIKLVLIFHSQVCFWCYGVATFDNISSCCSCERTACAWSGKWTESCFAWFWFSGKLKAAYCSVMGCC